MVSNGSFDQCKKVPACQRDEIMPVETTRYPTKSLWGPFNPLDNLDTSDFQEDSTVSNINDTFNKPPSLSP